MRCSACSASGSTTGAATSADVEAGGGGRFATPEERAVSVAAKRVVRMVFRALDHLPPGEISIADIGRAIIAGDTAAGGAAVDRKRLASELVRRGVVASTEELDTPVDVEIAKGERGDPQVLVAGLGPAARAFAKRHRALLGIPDGRPFDVLPWIPLATPGAGGRERLAFRVRWTNEEEHDLGPRFSRRWVIPAGTTLVLEGPDGGRAATVLTTDGGKGMRVALRNLRRRADGPTTGCSSPASRGQRRWAPRSSLRAAASRSSCRARPDSCT